MTQADLPIGNGAPQMVRCTEDELVLSESLRSRNPHGICGSNDVGVV